MTRALGGTPNVGFGLSDTAREYRIGWRLTSAVEGDLGFEVNLDATRNEAANGNGPVEHGLMCVAQSAGKGRTMRGSAEQARQRGLQ